MINPLLKILLHFITPYQLNLTTAAALLPVALGAVSSNQQAQAAKGAANAQQDASNQAIAEQRRQFGIAQTQAEPFRQAGLGALGQQQALLGLGGQEAQQQAFGAIQDSPGQQFIRQRQQRALLRNQAAIGGLGGGNVRTALQAQATGFAQQDLQNQFARLGGIAGQGRQVTQGLANLGANQASNVGNLQQAGAQAQASGILGAQQAQQQFISPLLGGLRGGAIGAQGKLGFGKGFLAGFK